MQSPLADRLRPRTLAEVCGQQHLLGPGRVFRKAIESGRVPNMIFYGPSGVGKTTVARIIAENSGMRLHKLNGTSAGTGDIKAVMAEIGTFQSRNGLLLYLDEIQYLNKKQQQSLLECMEDGTVTLIASTTENPYFYIYNALLSRATVFEFRPLTPEDVRRGLENALHKLEELDGVRIEAQPEALDALAAACGGDMRKALGSLNVAKVDAFGKVASGSFHRHVSAPGVKQLRWFLNRDAELYYFAFSKDGKKSLIVFEPSKAMVDNIRHYLPFGAYQEN